MDLLEQFLTAQREFGARVHAITEDQWQAGTPDTEWTVADLVEHLVDEHRWAAPLVHGHDLETAASIASGARSLPVDGGVGANFAEAWDEAAAASADAFSADSALDRSVQLSRGATPARDYLGEMILDLVVHGWDLQTAIGYSGSFDDEVVDATYERAQQMGDLAASGLFAAATDVDEHAPTIDKLVGLTGRNPR